MYSERKMEILILGGSRFIGYATACALEKVNHFNITVFNRQITKPPSTLSAEIKKIRGDRTEPNGYSNLPQKQFYDTVIDFSGYNESDVVGALNALQNKVGQYIFISSTNIYSWDSLTRGTNFSGPTESLFKVDSQKLRAETYLAYECEKLGIAWAVLRPHGVFGIYDPCQIGHIFYRLINGLPILGTARSQESFNPLYVHDLVDVIMKCIANDSTNNKSLNVAGDETVTLKKLVTICMEITKIQGSLVFPEDDESYFSYGVKFSRHGGPFIELPEQTMICDNRNVKNLLGIEMTPLSQSVTEMWSWFSKNPHKLKCFSFMGERKILVNAQISYSRRFYWKILKNFVYLRAALKKRILHMLRARI
jgi:2'-hydroxyisoflavone reductase